MLQEGVGPSHHHYQQHNQQQQQQLPLVQQGPPPPPPPPQDHTTTTTTTTIRMSHLTDKERELFAEVFLTMDANGNGWLEADELMEGCKRLGFNISDDTAEASFKAIDKNDDDKVTLDEFLAIMGHIEENNPRAKKEAKLRRAFREMDVDEDGLLTERELLDGMRDVGYNLSREQGRKLCSDLDKNGDGKIEFEEFIQMFQLGDDA